MVSSRRPGQRPRPGRGRASAGVLTGLLAAGEITASCVHPGLAAVVAIADAAAVLITLAAVVVLIVRGSDRTWERIFRLLRWAAGRAEPPSPAPGPSAGEAGGDHRTGPRPRPVVPVSANLDTRDKAGACWRV